LGQDPQDHQDAAGLGVAQGIGQGLAEGKEALLLDVVLQGEGGLVALEPDAVPGPLGDVAAMQPDGLPQGHPV
jgi:hypothetical protein